MRRVSPQDPPFPRRSARIKRENPFKYYFTRWWHDLKIRKPKSHTETTPNQKEGLAAITGGAESFMLFRMREHRDSDAARELLETAVAENNLQLWLECRAELSSARGSEYRQNLIDIVKPESNGVLTIRAKRTLDDFLSSRMLLATYFQSFVFVVSYAVAAFMGQHPALFFGALSFWAGSFLLCFWGSHTLLNRGYRF